jgi:hypothetical protein
LFVGVTKPKYATVGEVHSRLAVRYLFEAATSEKVEIRKRVFLVIRNS